MKKVLGIGNALVDVLVKLKDETLLSEFGLERGSMTLVDKDTMHHVLEKTDSLERQKSSGGSVANTIHGLSKLGARAGYIGKIGADDYGDFFASYMKQNDIETLLFSGADETGKSIVLISGDSERTFATFLGAAIELNPADLNVQHFEGYDYFHLEGYLVQNHALVEEAVKLASAAGNQISIDLASYNIVKENKDFLHSIVDNYIDIVFANEEEARAFTGKENPEEALNELAKKCKIAIVKVGKDGSLVKQGDKQFKIDAINANCIDT
ncbi:MAG: adenosine kinase, partial [bacterium]|nr:adenosine kinase [bacterium]